MCTSRRELVRNGATANLAEIPLNVGLARVMPATRRLLASTFLALGLLASGSAPAQLAPRHLFLQPLTLDGQAPDVFGAEVAIRDGFAFVGIGAPWSMDTGRVAVFARRPEGWVSAGTITPSDGTSGDQFGNNIYFRNGLVVVGSRRAVYVFKQVNGVWRERQKIVPPKTDGISAFALDLVHQDGVLAVGAMAQGGRGYVYVYEQNPTGRFVRRARLTSGDGSGVGFGGAISMTNRIIVTASDGAGYILGRNSKGNWVQRQKLLAADGSPLGGPLAVNRGLILISGPAAPRYEGPISPVGRSFYAFEPGRGQYVETYRFDLPSEVLQYNDHERRFGYSIVMFGNHVVIASWHYHLSNIEGQGSSVVTTYLREKSGLVPLGSIEIRGDPSSISVANNLLLIGTPYGTACYFPPCEGSAGLYDLNQFGP